MSQVFWGFDPFFQPVVSTVFSGQQTATLSNQNRTLTVTRSSQIGIGYPSRAGFITGKYFYEVTINTGTETVPLAVGVGVWGPKRVQTGTYPNGFYSILSANALVYVSDGYAGQLATDDPSGDIRYMAPFGETFGSGDTVSMAIDVDAGKAQFWKNGISQGTFTFNTEIGGNQNWIPMVGWADTADSDVPDTFTVTINCGDDSSSPFVVTPPNGYIPYGNVNRLDDANGNFIAHGNGLLFDNRISPDTPTVGTVYSSIGRISGQYYFEATVIVGEEVGGPGFWPGVGISGINKDSGEDPGSSEPGDDSLGYQWSWVGQLYSGEDGESCGWCPAYSPDANTITWFCNTVTYADVVGVAVDMDAGVVAFYKNGVQMTVPPNGTKNTLVFTPGLECWPIMISVNGSTGTSMQLDLNPTFLPDGYKAWGDTTPPILNPNPIITALSVTNDHVAFVTGNAGPATESSFDTWFEVTLASGIVARFGEDLAVPYPDNMDKVVSWFIPPTENWAGLPIYFVMRSNDDQIVYRSPPWTLDGIGFNGTLKLPKPKNVQVIPGGTPGPGLYRVRLVDGSNGTL